MFLLISDYYFLYREADTLSTGISGESNLKELYNIPGRHSCGREMDMRITDAKDDDKNPAAWILYGICKKCNIVVVCNMFLQAEEPIPGVDFIIDYEKKPGKGKERKG